MAAGDVDARITTLQAFNCASFDGVDDIITFSGYNRFDIKKGCTISFFVKSLVADASASSVSINDGTNQLMVSLNTDAAASNTGVRVSDIGFDDTFSSGSQSQPTLNKWYHVAGTYDGSNFITYLDGVAMLTDSSTLSTWNGYVKNIEIGGETIGTGSFGKQRIAMVKIYDVALSASDILKLSLGQDVSKNIVADIPLNGSALEKINNISGTITGATFSIDDNDVTTAVTEQRTATLSTGTFIFTNGMDGQIYHAAITEA